MPDHKNIIEILKHTSLFENCDDDIMSSFSAQSTFQSFEKGQVLFLHEEPAKRFFIIINGWVKLFRETLEGTQAVVDILSDNHIFGETSIFQNDTYPYSAEAVEPTKVLSLPLNLLKSEIEINPKIASSMLSSMAKFRRQQDQELEHRALQNAPQRIGCFLLRLTNQNDTGAVKIHLPYDKSLVASRLGMQPETFSRALAKLKDATGMEINGSTIELGDIKQLINYSCAACSSEFPCKDLGSQKNHC